MLLVTGGAGFIGSHLAERLLASGRDVVIVDNFDDFYPRGVKERNLEAVRSAGDVALEEGDIRDAAFLRRVFRDHQVEAVIHLAAMTGVRPSLAEPLLYEDVNVGGTLAVLEAMRAAGVAKMVFGSSSSVYGNYHEVPFRETAKLDRPVSPYAATKKAAELFCSTYHHLHGMDITCLRLFTVFGARQRPDLAIHKFARMILNGETIPVFGDGTSERDYTHVSDIVDGIVRALDRLDGFDIFNLGNSHPVPLAGLIEIIEGAVGAPASIERLPDQPGDVARTCADITHAKEALGYEPKVTLADGVREFVAWYRKEMM